MINKALFSVLLCLGGSMLITACEKQEPANSLGKAAAPMNNFRLVYAKNRNIAIGTIENNQINKEIELTNSGTDWKPSWSKTGNKIVFFRYVSGANPYPPTDPRDVANFKTKIVVINADGSGLKELTSGNYSDFNATWTRDGSNRIIFLRLSSKNPDKWDTYITSPDAQPGEEKLVGLAHENMAGYSTLKSGTVGFTGYGSIYLLKGNPLIPANWEQAKVSPVLPSEVFLSIFSFSPNEKRILYTASFAAFKGTYDSMQINGDNNHWDHKSNVLYLADFDAQSGQITNPRIISPKTSFDYRDGYPRWSADGRKVIFHSSMGGSYQLYLYDVESGSKPVLISPDNKSQYAFPCVENAPA